MPSTPGNPIDVTTSGFVKFNGSAFSTATGAIDQVVTQVFTGSGTYTPTTGMIYCIIEVVGGGGGGGSAQGDVNNVYAGGGGGAGGYARKTVDAATIGASQTVTIGSGGSGGSGSGANNGGSGGNSSVGAIVSANGSGGGLTGTTNTPGNDAVVTVDSGGGGASGVDGDFNTTSPVTGNGFSVYDTSFSAGAGFGGTGGSVFYGGGAKANTCLIDGSAKTQNGANATSYGGGGAGGFQSFSATGGNGGNGAGGIVVITEFISV